MDQSFTAPSRKIREKATHVLPWTRIRWGLSPGRTLRTAPGWRRRGRWRRRWSCTCAASWSPWPASGPPGWTCPATLWGRRPHTPWTSPGCGSCKCGCGSQTGLSLPSAARWIAVLWPCSKGNEKSCIFGCTIPLKPNQSGMHFFCSLFTFEKTDMVPLWWNFDFFFWIIAWTDGSLVPCFQCGRLFESNSGGLFPCWPFLCNAYGLLKQFHMQVHTYSICSKVMTYANVANGMCTNLFPADLF